MLFFITFLPQFVPAFDPPAVGELAVFAFYFITPAAPSSAPTVITAEHFAGALRRNPRVTRAVDWLFAGISEAFALKLHFARAQ